MIRSLHPARASPSVKTLSQPTHSSVSFRINQLRRSQSRNVSTSLTPPDPGLVSPVYYAISGTLATIHDTVGLPWWLTIPLATFAFKVLTTKVQLWRSQRLQPRSHMVVPFQNARKKLSESNSPSMPENKREERLFWLEFWERNARRRYSYTNLAQWRPVILYQTLPWLVISDCIRYMVGAPLGILSRVYPAWIAPANPDFLVQPSLLAETLPLHISTLAEPSILIAIIFGIQTFRLMRNKVLEHQGFLKFKLHFSDQQFALSSIAFPTIAFGIVQAVCWHLPACLPLYWMSSQTAGQLVLGMNRRSASRRKENQLHNPRPCTQGFPQNSPIWLLESRSSLNPYKPRPVVDNRPDAKDIGAVSRKQKNPRKLRNI
jgi:membrane protein insertase Oxa1/YidC/SpoIIIJ